MPHHVIIQIKDMPINLIPYIFHDLHNVVQQDLNLMLLQIYQV